MTLEKFCEEFVKEDTYIMLHVNRITISGFMTALLREKTYNKRRVYSVRSENDRIALSISEQISEE